MKYTSKLLGWLVLTCIFIEGLTRIVWGVLPVPQVIDPVRGPLPARGSIVRWSWEGSGITGYAGDGEIAAPFSEGLSAVVLGDSFTEAFQVNDAQKFVWQAGVRLADKGYAVHLRNLGASSLSIADYIYLEPYLKDRFAPKLVVITLNHTDYAEAFSAANDHYFSLQEGKLTLHNGASFSKKLIRDPLRNLLENSSFLRYAVGRFNRDFQGKLKALFNFRQVQPQTDVSTAAAQAQGDPKTMEKAIDLLAKTYQDYPLVVILLPQAPAIQKNTLECRDPKQEQQIAVFKKYPDIHWIDPSQRFCELAGQGQLPFGFDNSILGHGHLNPAGHAIIADLLAQEIEKIVNSQPGMLP